MLSYHNDPAIKRKFQERFAAHRAVDAVFQRTNVRNVRGDLVACILGAYGPTRPFDSSGPFDSDEFHDPARFPVELGWPEWLARLGESIFNKIPASEAPQFGADLLEAVPVGVELDPVRWKLAIWRNNRQLEMLISNPEPYVDTMWQAIRQVIRYCECQLDGTATDDMRKAAEFSAEAAIDAASGYSSESPAKYVSFSATGAARSASCMVRSPTRRFSAWDVKHAADNAAFYQARFDARPASKGRDYSKFYEAAESAYYQRERDMLLKLLREAL